jgi:dTDP-4-amino-4,6-dideoxygalactose transaminase
MKQIQMVDLQSQYQNIKPEIDAVIQNVLNSAGFINGIEVKSFQKKLENYLNVKHVIPCGNGTDALQIAMMALGLKEGDEVITVDFTFAATVEVIGLLGLTPVLVDVDPRTFNIDIEALEKAITPRTKAIVPVHLFGQAANMEALLEIAKQHSLFVIEDTAQALGADYLWSSGKTQKLGTLGTVGTTSFFPSKNLGAYGDGGAIFTNDDTLAVRLRSIVNHGMSKLYHYDRIGVNSRLDSMQAAILEVKLPHLDSYANARQRVADYYDQAFASCKYLTTPKRSKFTTHVFHQYTLLVSGGFRDDLHVFLKKHNIPNAIYYPVPLHQQEAYKHFRFDPKLLQNTVSLCNTVLSLPIHTEMTDEQLESITGKLLQFFKQK